MRKFHTGVDLAGPNHAAIRAADSGNVLYTGWYGGYGKVVILSHGNSMATLYAHMSKTAVEVGQNVAKGDIVGYEGTTGFSTARTYILKCASTVSPIIRSTTCIDSRYYKQLIDSTAVSGHRYSKEQFNHLFESIWEEYPPLPCIDLIAILINFNNDR